MAPAILIFVYILTFEWNRKSKLDSAKDCHRFLKYDFLERVRDVKFMYSLSWPRIFFWPIKDKDVSVQKAETRLHHSYVDAAFSELLNQYPFFRYIKMFFLLNASDNILFINKIFLLVLPVVDERDNWISEELVQINTNIISCLFSHSALICQYFYWRFITTVLPVSWEHERIICEMPDCWQAVYLYCKTDMFCSWIHCRGL